MLAHPLVHPFVASTYEHNAIEHSQLCRGSLIESLSLRGKQNYGLLYAAGHSIFPRLDLQCLQTFK